MMVRIHVLTDRTRSDAFFTTVELDLNARLQLGVSEGAVLIVKALPVVDRGGAAMRWRRGRRG